MRPMDKQLRLCFELRQVPDALRHLRIQRVCDRLLPAELRGAERLLRAGERHVRQDSRLRNLPVLRLLTDGAGGSSFSRPRLQRAPGKRAATALSTTASQCPPAPKPWFMRILIDETVPPFAGVKSTAPSASVSLLGSALL